MVDEQILRSIHYTVGEIAGKVNLLVQQGAVQDDRHAALEGRVRVLERGAPDDLEPRMRHLENRQHWYAGAAAAIGATGAYVAKMFFGPHGV